MKNIPVQLMAHYASGVTTTCHLVKVRCKGAFAGRNFGFTSLDVDITYNDGDGPVLYESDNGFAPAAFESASDMSVANTEIKGWSANSGITVQQVRAGLLDFAEITIYRINYLNPGMGHEVVGFGTCGQARISGDRWTVEFRSLMQQLKQSINKVWSLTCRAQYGDSQCKKAFEWTSGTVQTVSEPTRVFTCDTFKDVGFYQLGVIRFTSGANAGQEMEIDDYRNGTIILALPMLANISPGDTYVIRQDCDKLFTTCQARNNVLNFRGEHLTPVSDTSLSVPGAYITAQSS